MVSNGRDAVAALDEGRFDAVLMDVQMPRWTGFRRRPLSEPAMREGSPCPLLP